MVLLVSGVCVCVHVTTQRKPLSRVDAYRGTWAQMCAREQVMVVTFVKWINSFYFIRTSLSCFILTFYFFLIQAGGEAAGSHRAGLFMTKENNRQPQEKVTHANIINTIQKFTHINNKLSRVHKLGGVIVSLVIL